MNQQRMLAGRRVSGCECPSIPNHPNCGHLCQCARFLLLREFERTRVHKFSLLFSLVAVSSSQRSMGDLESLVAESKAKISALIQKPKMAEKLLSKPPFRFLHDTITAISVATGFAEGLYADAELDAAAMTDKNAKTAYLDKIFLLVGICKVRSATITLHLICFISFK